MAARRLAVKVFLRHALIVASIFLGSDMVVNDGAETQKLLRATHQSLLVKARMQAYYIGNSVERSAYSARPTLAMVGK
jgi:hypothetical protein